MTQTRVGFVVWIDAATSRRGRLRGSAEWTRGSERVEFGTTFELLRFLERIALAREGAGRAAPRHPEDPR